jgi:hypothetical protein
MLHERAYRWPQRGLSGARDDAPVSTTSASWTAPPVTTDVAAARLAYRLGVARLVAGIPGWQEALEEALALDGDLLLARVALAAARALEGEPFVSPPCTRPVSLAERQHAEVVAHAFGTDPARLHDLRRRHLEEHPGDILVVWLPLAATRPRSGGGCACCPSPSTRS